MVIYQHPGQSFLWFVYELVLQMVIPFSSETKLTEFENRKNIFSSLVWWLSIKYSIYILYPINHISCTLSSIILYICNKANGICRRKVSSLGPFLTFQDFTNLSEEGRGLFPQGSVNFFYKFGTELETYTCFCHDLCARICTQKSIFVMEKEHPFEHYFFNLMMNEVNQMK